MNRRQFLGTAGATAGGAAAPLILPSRLFGASAPSNRVTLGFIGTGRQAMGMNIPEFMAVPGVQVVAVCDVDSWRLGEAKTAGRGVLREADRPAGTYTGCATYRDFRELLARPDIDAVMISTPDHWHVPMAAAALRAGKDVSLEKPITRYISEAGVLADLVAAHKRVFRVDSEFRSLERFHRAVELVRNGRIGKLHTIRSGSPVEEFPEEPEAVDAAAAGTGLRPVARARPGRAVHPEAGARAARPEEPAGLVPQPAVRRRHADQLGRAPQRHRAVGQRHRAHRARSRSGPPASSTTGRSGTCSSSFDAWYRFANGVEMFYTMGEPHVRFEGDKGWIQVNYFKTAGTPSCSKPATRPSCRRRSALASCSSRSERARRLHRGRQDARPDAGRRGGRPAHDFALPPGVHLDPARRRDTAAGTR